MFCQNCGAAAEPEGHYCKRCGELLPTPANRRFRNSFLVMPYLNLLCALLAAASFVALLWAFPNDSGGWAVTLAGVSCFLIAVYQIVTFLMSLSLRRKVIESRGAPGREAREVREGAEPLPLRPADTSAFVRAPSVTEHTTELLGVAHERSKGAHDD